MTGDPATAGAGTAADLQVVEVDGVPAFWVPAAGRLSVALLFGVGVRDESLVNRGVDHLVEHLSVFGLDHRTLDFNAHVSPSATAFTTTGDLASVQTFLDHVGAALAAPDGERLHLERRVLRTEARSRSWSRNGLHLDHRFGPNGIGLLDAEELGLRWLAEADLRSWIGTWFTGANAALAVVGPDPRALHLRLPPGPRPLRAPGPPELVDRPSWTATPGNVVALSTTAPRSPRWTVATTVLAEVAEHRLRQVEGRSYAVVDLAIPVDAERSYHYLGADCLDEEADQVREALSAELTRLRTRGPTDTEVRGAVTSLLRQLTDDRMAMGGAYAAADAALLGRDVPTPGQLAADLEAVTPDHVATALDEAHARLLWSVPFNAPVEDRRYSLVPRWSSHRVDGTEYRPGSGRDQSRAADRLVVGPNGVSLVVGTDPATVRWDDLRAASRYQDRVWLLHGTDGATVGVRARDWFGGADAIADIALLAPRHLVVDMGEPMSPDEPDNDPAAPLAPSPLPSPSGPAPAPAAPPSPTDPASRPGAATAARAGSSWRDPGPHAAVAIVWVLAAAVAAWILTTMDDGTGNRAKAKVIGLVVVGAAYTTRMLLRR